ncbi:MAG: sugar isomerase domain-containing protein [bacterium]
MPGTTQRYAEAVKGLIDKIASTQEGSIERAARAILDCWERGGRVWIIGPGVHSYMGVEEMCYRSGGLFDIYAMECNFLSLGGVKAWTATMLERTPGLALSIFKASGVERKDLVIINNQYGINPVAIESALVARAMGVPTIGITSSEFCKEVPPGHPARHPSNKNLHEEVDIHINTWMPPGDAVLEIEGFDQKVAPTSTSVMAFAVNALVAKVVDIAVREGRPFRAVKSGNTPGGDEYNKRNFQELGDALGYGGAKGRDEVYPTPEEIEAMWKR